LFAANTLLAECLVVLHEYVEAETPLMAVYPQYVDSFGETHPVTVNAQEMGSVPTVVEKGVGVVFG